MLIELAILQLLIYTPIGHAFFGASPLTAWIFVPLIGGSLVLLAAEEGRKALVRGRDSRCQAGV
ncbi:MAG TPA: hypothetical protein VF019_00830 [Nitrospira sp.]